MTRNATYTKNLNLTKDNEDEFYDVNIVNENLDKIDKAIGNNTSQLNDLMQDSYPIVEATGTNTYVGASARIKSVGKGTRCTLFVGTASTGNCSLNINGSGAAAIKDSNGNVVTNLKANIPYNLCHNGSDFILQGKGGGGNLIAKYLLSGYYGEGDNGRVDGAMVNRGTPTSALNCGGTYNLQEGYYSGGKVTANSLASQTPANATASDIISGKTAWVNGIKLTGTAKEEPKLISSGTFHAGSLSSDRHITLPIKIVSDGQYILKLSSDNDNVNSFFVFGNKCRNDSYSEMFRFVNSSETCLSSFYTSSSGNVYYYCKLTIDSNNNIKLKYPEGTSYYSNNVANKTIYYYLYSIGGIFH